MQQPNVFPEFASELHHGWWWTETAKDLCTGEHEILVPIIGYMDSVSTDNNGRLPVTPFNITLGIFNTETRRKAEAWTTILLYPDDNAEASIQKGTKPIHKIQNLHNSISVAFRELKELMESKNSIAWRLPYGPDGKEWKVFLKFAFAYVIGDTEMHDKLCGRYGPRTKGVKSVCRHCTAKTDELVKGGEIFEGNHLYTPEMLDADKYCAEYFKSVSHHPIRNAFHELDFGANRFNIHLELLHMVQKGACTRSIEGFVEMWKNPGVIQDDVTAVDNNHKSPILLDQLDHLGKVYGGYLFRQSDRNKPRNKFRSSLFKNCKKNGHEHTGVILDVLCALLSDRGRQIVAERGVDERWVENYFYLFEILLQFEQFMKMKEVPIQFMLDERPLGKAMDHLLDRIDGTIHQGEKTMGNNTAKNHLLSHLPQYASYWGPLTGMDLGDSERNHKFQVKRQAWWTQRREGSFQGQYGNRWTETRLVTRAVNKYRDVHGYFMDGQAKTAIGDKEITGALEKTIVLAGTHFDIGVDGNGRPVMGWSDPTRRGRATHPQPVVDFICHHVMNKIQGDTIHGRTEANVIIGGKQEKFRAHPNCRSDSHQSVNMWYDWATFEYQSQSGSIKVLPAQIAAIVMIGELRTGFSNQPKVRGYPLMPCLLYAAVRLFHKEPKLKFRRSVFVQRAQYTYSVKWGELREGFLLLPLNKKVHTAIVVPNVEEDPGCAVRSHSPLGGGFFVIPSWDKLCDDFLDVIRQESADLVSESEQEEDNEDGEDEEQEDSDGDEGDDDNDNGDNDHGEGGEAGSDDNDNDNEDDNNDSNSHNDSGGDNHDDGEDCEDEDDDDDSGISFIECKRVNYLRRYIDNLNLE